MLTIPEIKRRITPVLEAYDVKSAFLFGSYARGDATDESDVDIRIDRGDSKKLSGFSIGGFYLDIKEALGCEVDLLTKVPKGLLSDSFNANLKKDEVLLYERK